MRDDDELAEITIGDITIGSPDYCNDLDLITIEVEIDQELL